MTDILTIALWILPGLATVLAVGSHVRSTLDGDTLSVAAWRMSSLGGAISFTTIVLVWVASDCSTAVLGALVWDTIKLMSHQTCFMVRYFRNNKIAGRTSCD
jgi:hypothetical protein